MSEQNSNQSESPRKDLISTILDVDMSVGREARQVEEGEIVLGTMSENLQKLGAYSDTLYPRYETLINKLNDEIVRHKLTHITGKHSDSECAAIQEKVRGMEQHPYLVLGSLIWSGLHIEFPDTFGNNATVCQGGVVVLNSGDVPTQGAQRAKQVDILTQILATPIDPSFDERRNPVGVNEIELGPMSENLRKLVIYLSHTRIEIANHVRSTFNDYLEKKRANQLATKQQIQDFEKELSMLQDRVKALTSFIKLAVDHEFPNHNLQTKEFSIRKGSVITISQFSEAPPVLPASLEELATAFMKKRESV